MLFKICLCSKSGCTPFLIERRIVEINEWLVVRSCCISFCIVIFQYHKKKVSKKINIKDPISKKFNFISQFYNNLEPTGNRFLYMYLGYHQTRKYHSESNYLGIKLDAHVYRNYYNRKNPNFNLSYMAVGKFLLRFNYKVFVFYLIFEKNFCSNLKFKRLYKLWKTNLNFCFFWNNIIFEKIRVEEVWRPLLQFIKSFQFLAIRNNTTQI